MQAVLRTRGGAPPDDRPDGWSLTCSPHARRCSRNGKRHYSAHCLFSARAEVLLRRANSLHRPEPVLRTRGGAPTILYLYFKRQSCSPHVRRCSSLWQKILPSEHLFSACTGHSTEVASAVLSIHSTPSRAGGEQELERLRGDNAEGAPPRISKQPVKACRATTSAS